jgi:hypothetical protein
VPKPRIYPIGSRHKLGYWVDKANHDRLADNLDKIGFKSMTELLDHVLGLYVKRVNRHYWRLEGKGNRDGSMGPDKGDRAG